MNPSPKGMETLRVVDERRIRWLNLSGSGDEPAAHLREDPRMTLMFCAFDGNPLILRVYGASAGAASLRRRLGGGDGGYSGHGGAGQIFDLGIELAQTSCVAGAPKMQATRERGSEDLLPFHDAIPEDEQREYWRRKNKVSIDGRPTGVLNE